MRKSIILATLIILSLSFSFTQSAYTCTDKDRTADCTGVKSEKVCALYDKTIQCFAFPCGIDKTSQCEACKESNIESVEFMTCETLRSSQSSSTTPADSEPIKEKCSEEERNRPLEECSQDEVTEHCAWFPDTVKCKAYPCAETVKNRCYACSQERFAYVSKGSCPQTGSNSSGSTGSGETTAPDADSSYTCTEEDRSKFCTEEWRGVCAHLNKETCTENCLKSFGTFCQACQNKEVVFVVNGECNSEVSPIVDPAPNPEPVEEVKIEKTTCTDSQRNMMCTMEYLGVCAVKFADKCKEGELCRYNSGTVCQACSSEDIEVVYNVECHNIFKDDIKHLIKNATTNDTTTRTVDESQKQYCKDSDRGKSCTKEYTGYCAYKNSSCDKANDNCIFTASTFCTGCSLSDVEYVVEGVCDHPPSSEEAENLAADGIVYKGDDKMYTMSVEKDVYVEAYKCKESDRALTCTQESKPVCAYEKCTSGLCPKTETNKCQACKKTSVVYTANLECSSINIPRLRLPCSAEEKNVTCSTANTVVNKKVCGKYAPNSKLCLSESCNKEYETSCQACAVADIQTYVVATCDEEKSYSSGSGVVNVSVSMVVSSVMLLFLLF